MTKLTEREERDRFICDSVEALSIHINGIELLAKLVVADAEGKEGEEASICATTILTLCEKLQMEIEKVAHSLRSATPPQEA